MERFLIFCLCISIQIFCCYATLGVDMSSPGCQGMTLQNWECLVKNDYHFAIIQTWQGGYKYNPKIAQCVNDAKKAGMAHVDVYAFMCPNCAGNNPPQTAVKEIVDNLRAAKVPFGCYGLMLSSAKDVGVEILRKIVVLLKLQRHKQNQWE